jgi:hypothetical protein
MDLRDKNGKVLGRIMKSSDGTLRLYDSIGAFKGSYDPRTDSTYDKYGAFYGSGNILAMILSEP